MANYELESLSHFPYFYHHIGTDDGALRAGGAFSFRVVKLGKGISPPVNLHPGKADKTPRAHLHTQTATLAQFPVDNHLYLPGLQFLFHVNNPQMNDELRIANDESIFQVIIIFPN